MRSAHRPERDVQLKPGDATRVVTSTGVRKCDQSQDIRAESYPLTGVGHTTKVASSDQSWAYDRSRA
jgi:hypothetical protein